MKVHFNNEAEQGLIGAMLFSPNNIVEIQAEFPNVGEFFFDIRHKSIFEAMIAEGTGDLAILQPRLRDLKQLEALGGMAYLAGMLGKTTGTLFEAQGYAEKLRHDWVRRRVQELAIESMELSDNEQDSGLILEEVEKRLLSISMAAQSDSDLKMPGLIQKVMDGIEFAMNNRGRPRGIETGIHDFDRMTYGLKGGQVIIIAARPSVGKTSLAMNIVDKVAVEDKIPAGVFTLEMTGPELVYRMVCTRARIDSQRAQDGDLTERDKPRLFFAMNEIQKAPIQICEKGGLTIAQLSARARRMAIRHKIKLLVIDYLQLMTSRLKENANARITEISNGIKTLAKDLNIPVIVLSQLNRDSEKENRKPRLSDLRESGSIEQDADIVMLLAPEPPDPDKTFQKVEVLIPKHRNGPVGKFDLNFNRKLTRFESVSKVADVDTGPSNRNPYPD